MSGESNLATLLKTLRPRLHPDPFTFCTLKPRGAVGVPVRLLAAAVGMFREAEGVTLILPVRDARAEGLEPSGEWALISLDVHSDLNAVGLLATLTRRLANASISVNAVSAYYHDHLFVPWHERDRALNALNASNG